MTTLDEDTKIRENTQGHSMSLCHMTAGQILSYINFWTVLIAVIVTNVIVVTLYRITSGAMREAQEYARGYQEAENKYRRPDRNLALGLTDYDAQRIVAPTSGRDISPAEDFTFSPQECAESK